METRPTLPQLIADGRIGDQEAVDRLLPLVYEELRVLADAYLSRERPDHTLQPTALVNEVYLRLLHERDLSWQNRAHFIGIAARSMRQLLAKHAKAHGAAKRGGPVVRDPTYGLEIDRKENAVATRTLLQRERRECVNRRVSDLADCLEGVDVEDVELALRGTGCYE